MMILLKNLKKIRYRIFQLRLEDRLDDAEAPKSLLDVDLELLATNVISRCDVPCGFATGSRTFYTSYDEAESSHARGPVTLPDKRRYTFTAAELRDLGLHDMQIDEAFFTETTGFFGNVQRTYYKPVAVSGAVSLCQVIS